MERCPKCKEYTAFQERHKCLPMWDVYNDEYAGDEVHKVRAFDAKEAAEKYTDRWDDERDLIDGSIEVEVQDGDVRRKFSVSASISIDYSATEQK